LISNYHVVKDATKVRLITGAGLIDAKVVQVDAANDLALPKTDGRFASLPIVPVARWVWAAQWQAFPLLDKLRDLVLLSGFFEIHNGCWLKLSLIFTS
jgi:hypothetical protein